MRGRLDRLLDQLLGRVALLGIVVEPGHRQLRMDRFLIELFRLAELSECLLRLAQLKQHDPLSLASAGIVGIEFEPGGEVLLGGVPLLPRLGHGSASGVATDLEVTLPLGILAERGGEFRRLGKQHVGIGDAAILECEITQHQVGLGVARKLDRGVFQFDPRRLQLVHAQPEHGHHDARGGQFGIVRPGSLQQGPAADDVAIAEAADGIVDVAVLGVV